MALGIAGTEMLARVVNAVAAHQPAEALAVVDDLVMRGHDLRNFCRDLLAHLRDLLVAKVSGGAGELLESSATEKSELLRQAGAFSESDLVRCFHSLTETENSLRTAAHPRYQLEVGLVKLMEMRRVAPLNQLLERLGALEEALRTGQAPALHKTPPAAAGGGGGAPVRGGSRSASSGSSTQRAGGATKSEVAAATSAGSQTPAGEPPFDGVGGTTARPSSMLTLVPATEVQGGGAQAAAATRSAPDVAAEHEGGAGQGSAVGASAGGGGAVIEKIKAALEKRHRMFLVIALEGARRTSVEGDELSVEFTTESKHLRDSLAKPESVKILREVCLEVLGRDVSVRISVKEPGETNNELILKQDEELREKQRLREIAERHPMVQEFLQTFRGEIIDVRRVDGE
jgi:DNA polymerase-3 subunit gamma/tau